MSSIGYRVSGIEYRIGHDRIVLIVLITLIHVIVIVIAFTFNPDLGLGLDLWSLVVPSQSQPKRNINSIQLSRSESRNGQWSMTTYDLRLTSYDLWLRTYHVGTREWDFDFDLIWFDCETRFMRFADLWTSRTRRVLMGFANTEQRTPNGEWQMANES